MRKVLDFFAEVRQIFHQITWPNRDTLIQLTVVVISISAIVALVLGGFDYLFTNTVGILTNLQANQIPKTEIAQPTITASPSASLSPTITLTIKK